MTMSERVPSPAQHETGDHDALEQALFGDRENYLGLARGIRRESKSQVAGNMLGIISGLHKQDARAAEATVTSFQGSADPEVERLLIEYLSKSAPNPYRTEKGMRPAVIETIATLQTERADEVLGLVALSPEEHLDDRRKAFRALKERDGELAETVGDRLFSVFVQNASSEGIAERNASYLAGHVFVGNDKGYTRRFEEILRRRDPAEEGCISPAIDVLAQSHAPGARLTCLEYVGAPDPYPGTRSSLFNQIRERLSRADRDDAFTETEERAFCASLARVGEGASNHLSSDDEATLKLARALTPKTEEFVRGLVEQMGCREIMTKVAKLPDKWSQVLISAGAADRLMNADYGSSWYAEGGWNYKRDHEAEARARIRGAELLSLDPRVFSENARVDAILSLLWKEGVNYKVQETFRDVQQYQRLVQFAAANGTQEVFSRTGTRYTDPKAMEKLRELSQEPMHRRGDFSFTDQIDALFRRGKHWRV